MLFTKSQYMGFRLPRTTTCSGIVPDSLGAPMANIGAIGTSRGNVITNPRIDAERDSAGMQFFTFMDKGTA